MNICETCACTFGGGACGYCAACMKDATESALAGESAALEEVARLESLASEQDKAILTLQYRAIELARLLREVWDGEQLASECLRRRIKAALEK